MKKLAYWIEIVDVLGCRGQVRVVHVLGNPSEERLEGIRDGIAFAYGDQYVEWRTHGSHHVVGVPFGEYLPPDYEIEEGPEWAYEAR